MSICKNCGSSEEIDTSFCSHCGFKFIGNKQNLLNKDIRIIPFEKTKYHPAYKKNSKKIYDYPFDYGFIPSHTKWLTYVIAINWASAVIMLIIALTSLFFIIFGSLFGGIALIGKTILFIPLIALILFWLYLRTIWGVGQYNNESRRDNIALILFLLVLLVIRVLIQPISSIFRTVLPPLTSISMQLYGLVYHKPTLELFSDYN